MTDTSQNQNQFQNQNPMQGQMQNQFSAQNLMPNAPYAVASLILGIVSLLTGCLFIGLILGIVGLVLANKGNAIYIQNPSHYKGYSMLHTGKVLSILGIVFGAIGLISSIIAIIAGGSMFFLFEDVFDMLDIW